MKSGLAVEMKPKNRRRPMLNSCNQIHCWLGREDSNRRMADSKRTAHAALVARQMGKPCVVGCTGLSVDAMRRNAELAGAVINEGDWLSIDGGSGAIYLGRGNIAIDRPEAELAQIKRWQNQSAR